jgi:type IV secretory pathway component VirB8
MIRFFAVAAFALAVATSAQAITLTPLHQTDGMITQVRENCGAGMRWNEALGRCATTSARRHVRRGVIQNY